MSEQDTRLMAEKLLDAAYARIDTLKAELAKARNAALEEAAKLIEEGFDRGIKRKQDTCSHSKFEWEDCESCAAAAIRALREEE